MSRRVRRVVFALILLAGLAAFSAPAWAACGNVHISPNPAWRGAQITVTADIDPNGAYYFNFHDYGQVKSGNADSSGHVSFKYTIPNDAPNPNGYFLGADCNPMIGEQYLTIYAQQPTTTTTSTTTTTTTTTLAPTTTTTAAPTTTAAATTTTQATTTTAAPTTTVAETTTTTESGGGGSSSAPLIIGLAAAAAILVGLVVFTMGRRRS